MVPLSSMCICLYSQYSIFTSSYSLFVLAKPVHWYKVTALYIQEDFVHNIYITGLTSVSIVYTVVAPHLMAFLQRPTPRVLFVQSCCMVVEIYKVVKFILLAHV